MVKALEKMANFEIGQKAWGSDDNNITGISSRLSFVS
jgi:hypothetical protein